MSNSFEETITRYRAFWNRDATDRPLVGTTINPIPSIRAVIRDGILKPEDLDIEENLHELDEEWEQWKGASGDVIWAASPVWAFHWLTAIAGCPNQRRGDIVWIEPGLDTLDDLSGIELDRNHPWFRRLVEFISALVEHAAGRYPVAAPSLGGCADLLMHLRGPERLAADLYDAPEKVVELGARCVDLCEEVINAIYDVVPQYMGGYPGTIRFFWAPGRIIEMAEDLSIMMSPMSHHRFVAPIHQELGRRFPYNILHLHSVSLHTVDNVLEIPEVRAIEITPDFGVDMRPYIPLLERILERKSLIVHGVMTVEVMKELMDCLPARGLCLFCRCDSAEEGARILDAVL